MDKVNLAEKLGPATTLSTGNLRNERTVDAPERL
jgi:hypothetical protein